MTENVARLFKDEQPGPNEEDLNTNFIEMARSISRICATRALLMIVTVAGALIWAWTTYQPTTDRLYVAVAFSLVFVLPQVALYWRRG